MGRHGKTGAVKTNSAKQIATRLATARKAWDLTQQQLAQRAGVPHSEVRIAERTGRVEVSTLVSLVGTLGGVLDDLFSGATFWEAPAIALKSASHEEDPATLMQGLAKVSTAARDYHALSRFLELPDWWAQRGAALGPLNVEGSVVAQAEVLAGRVRKELGNPLNPIPSVRADMARFGIATFFTQFASEAVDGATWIAAKAPPCVVVNARARGGLVTAARMTFAHELCHALFDRPRKGDYGHVEVKGARGSDLEKRANAFAAYFLAPRLAVRRFLGESGLGAGTPPTQQHLLSLSLYFGMGVEAMAHHLVNCDFWSEATMLRNKVQRAPPFASMDDRELRTTGSDGLIALERRGSLLDIANIALAQKRITTGRWRELLGLSATSNWRLILEERDIVLDDEHYVIPRGEHAANVSA
nr:ImmA/IrrE family metallo-endopeptidase [Myxococcus fulvus]